MQCNKQYLLECMTEICDQNEFVIVDERINKLAIKEKILLIQLTFLPRLAS